MSTKDLLNDVIDKLLATRSLEDLLKELNNPMSTRAVVTFKDQHHQFSIYQHHDGYPEGVLPNIQAAYEFAWEGSRYEAMDFAAAYVRANKPKGGGSVYLTTGPDRHGDLEYTYAFDGKEVTVCHVYEKEPLFKGPLDAARIFFKLTDENG
jgi:hypothetical protein